MMMRIAPVLAIAGLLALAPASGRAQGGESKESAPVKSYALPPEAGGPAAPVAMPGAEARKGAPMGVKQTAMRAGRMADEKLEEAISTLNQLIDASDDDDPSKPEYLARLAALYWDKAENFFNKAYGDELFLRLKAAQDAGDEAGVAQVQAEQAQLLKERVYWQEEAANVYMMIVDRFPDYPSIDSVLYYLGFALVQMDMQDKAFPYFTRIVREAPNSRFVPDALLNIAEYYFNNSQMEDATAIYTEVENFPQSSAYGLAIYKKGWCYYNMGLHEQAMNQFLKVIDYARAEEARKIGYGNQLLREAQRDLVMVYSQVGSPESAIKVFKAISPGGYMDLAIKLAEGYSSQGEYKKSSILFKKIIAEIKDAEDSYRMIEFQRWILNNAYRVGVKEPVVEETRRLIGLLDLFRGKAPADYYQPELAKAEELVRVIVTTYHKEVRVTKETATMEFTHNLYNEYLRLFPDAKEFAAMTLNYAILLEQLAVLMDELKGKKGFDPQAQIDKFAEAAERYSVVADLKPDPEVALQAAHGAVRCYYQMLDVKSHRAKSEDTLDTEPKPLPEFEQKLVAASERYLRMAPPDAPDIVQARFAASMVKYQYNQFDDAAGGFRQIIVDHADSEIAPDAARLLLSSLALSRNIKGLNEAAGLVGANPALMQGDVPGIVQRINEQKDFNQCFEFEQQGRNVQAAECFLDYVKRFPGTPLKDRSLINAGNNFFKARLVERSLKANSQLVNEMPGSPLAARALYNIADTYRRLAVYSEAARIYETFVSLQPNHELTEEALRYATIFRTGLGEYDAAIKDLRKYLQLFPKSQYAASVAFDIASAYEKQGKKDLALKEYTAWLAKFGQGGGLDLFLRAHLRIARLNEGMRGGAAKAQEWFRKTVAAYEALTDEDKAKVTAAGLAAAAEARFMEGEAALAEVRAVQLKLPEKVLVEGITKKVELIAKAMDLLTSVEGFAQPNWTIAATSRKGQALQELATSIENSPVPGGLNSEQKMFYRQGMADRAAPLIERAKEAYRRCVEVARELKWYNEYSAKAEEALLDLDPDYRVLPDIRPAPGAYTLNRGRATLLAEREGAEAPKWTDAGVETRIREAAQAAGATAEALYNMGSLAMSKRDLAGAKSWYGKAIEKKPDFVAAISRLGLVALAEGREADAVAQFDRALDLDPADAGANTYYGAKALLAKDYVEAVNLARKALVSDPDSMDAYQILAATYLEMGLLDVGILVARNAIGIYPTNGAVQNLLGLIFLRMGEVRQAVQLFQKAANDDPELYDAHFNLGAVTLGYMDFATAADQFGKAVALRPGTRDALLGLAVAKRGAGDAEGAKRILDELAADPNGAAPHFNLCLLYQENLGDNEKALAECETFARLAGPQDPKAKAVQMRINGIRATIEVLRETK